VGTPLVIAGTLAFAILIAIGVVHIYWAGGGRLGRDAAIPTLDGQPVLHPSPPGTVLVAVGLFLMAALVAVRVGWIIVPGVTGMSRVGAWLLVGVFSARAIGDFRYVGFFKRVRDSRFARLDTRVYSPLCVLLALLITVAATL